MLTITHLEIAKPETLNQSRTPYFLDPLMIWVYVLHEGKSGRGGIHHAAKTEVGPSEAIGFRSLGV